MEASNRVQRYGRRAIGAVEVLGLLVIAIATVIAAAQEVELMVDARQVRLEDLLMLFIYLEVVAMVGLYLESGQLPVRLPMYIGMVALARYLILDMKGMNNWRMLAVSASVLLLALAVLVVRYGHVRFPYDARDSDRPADGPRAPDAASSGRD
ncbi:MAG TPA: phosphate-starvation-inducible PsiE family protein [Gammaproteobacteria bacterium]|nr:phosphate-starvation-inducible PsiE family protein [Gammaproteobacteria bacterium]